MPLSKIHYKNSDLNNGTIIIIIILIITIIMIIIIINDITFNLCRSN